jgi:phage baseplate assembly protein W
MAVYIGFSTQRFNLPRNESITVGVDGGSGSLTQPIQIGKKFRLIDEQLILQDFINALNIPQGTKPGKPSYGTTIWTFVFEPNTPDMQFQLENEIRRVATQDPRLILNSVISYPQENGILIEVEVAVSPFNNAGQLQIFFDQQSNSASLV